MLTWNMNGIRSVVAKFGNMKALLEALSAGGQAVTLLSMVAVQHMCPFRLLQLHSSAVLQEHTQRAPSACMLTCACCGAHADIICLQETKAQLDSELAVVEGW